MLTPEQRAVDLSILNTHTEVLDCWKNVNLDKTKVEDDYLATVEKFVGGLDEMLAGKSGFIHGRKIPSIADIACYSLVMYFLEGKDKFKDSFPNVRRIHKLVCDECKEQDGSWKNVKAMMMKMMKAKMMENMKSKGMNMEDMKKKMMKKMEACDFPDKEFLKGQM